MHCYPNTKPVPECGRRELILRNTIHSFLPQEYSALPTQRALSTESWPLTLVVSLEVSCLATSGISNAAHILQTAHSEVVFWEPHSSPRNSGRWGEDAGSKGLRPSVDSRGCLCSLPLVHTAARSPLPSPGAPASLYTWFFVVVTVLPPLEAQKFSLEGGHPFPFFYPKLLSLLRAATLPPLRRHRVSFEMLTELIASCLTDWIQGCTVFWKCLFVSVPCLVMFWVYIK